MKLHDYWRSSASYRVRIGLALKGLEAERVVVDLRQDAHLGQAFTKLNPQGLVPALETPEGVVTQSLAILEYLDDLHPARPLLAADPLTRARQRAMAQVIACDVHPICNLRVLRRLSALGQNEAGQKAWMREWMHAGFATLEAMVTTEAAFLGGDTPMLPDLVLVPQIYNARRFGIELEAFPKLVAIDRRCAQLDAFASAAPQQ